MALSDWLSGDLATAIPATFATGGVEPEPTVATVAKIAVAKHKRVETVNKDEGWNDNWDSGSFTLATAIPATSATEPPLFCTGWRCIRHEVNTLPGSGPTPGCIIRHKDHETWRRLDRLESCPLDAKRNTALCKSKPERKI